MLDGLRILLAEDNPTNQLVAVQMLETLGATVAVADDGVMALERLDAAEFDILLIDIEMPRMNGIELMKAIRSSGAPRADLPLIALTAYVMTEHRAAIMAAGADGIIAKPLVSVEGFGEQVRDLAKRRLAEARRACEAASPVPTHPAHSDIAPSEANHFAVARTVIGRTMEDEKPLDPAALDALRHAVGADAVREIVLKAVDDIGLTGKRLSDAVEASDLGAVRGALHVLMGLAGAVGARRLESEVKDLQERVRLGETRNLAPKSLAVRREVDVAVAHLSNL